MSLYQGGGINFSNPQDGDNTLQVEIHGKIYELSFQTMLQARLLDDNFVFTMESASHPET
jgi:hypothetical protein